MLRSRNQQDDHLCHHLITHKFGQFKDLTINPFYSSSIPCRVQNFIPRPKIMADVVSALNRNRFITLKGIPGIGKSILGREIFKDGVIYIQLLGCESIQGFFHSLYGWIFQGSTIKYKTNHKESIERIVTELKNKNALIYIDNCDTIVCSNDKNIFKNAIEAIFSNCNGIHLLFTCRIRLGQIFNSYEIDSCTEKVITVQKLGLQDSMKLFLSKVPNPQQIKQEKIGEFIKAAKVSQLKFHPLFEFLNGHPQAVCMSAALLDGRSLKQLYQLLANQSLAQVFTNDDKKGYNAFRISLQVSWNIIKKRASQRSNNQGEKQAAQMFKVMGMLPSGVDKQTMPKIFGAKWRQAVKILQKYSLLKQTDKVGVKYYSIYPHMLTFAENQLERQQKKYFHQKICEQLQKRLFQKIYKNVGTGSALSQGAAQIYFYQQNNYKACIYRQYANLGWPQKLRSLYSNILNQDCEDSDMSQTNSIASSRSSRSKFKMDGLKKNVFDDTLSQSSMDQKKPIRHAVSKSKSPYKDKGFLKLNLNASMTAKRRDPPSVLRLILFQATILFILKNFSACQKIVSYGRELAQRMKSPLAQANLIRILACIALYKRNQAKARDLFGKALELFANIGCGLGVASCEAALGYIRHIEQQYAQAKKNLQNALKYYDQIPHIFGKHYLNRWLLFIKTKIKRDQNQLITHNEQAKKLFKDSKIALKGNKIDSFQLKHKAGFFVFRFMFDNISLFLECAFEIDVRPTKRTTNTLKNQTSLSFKPILPMQPPKKIALQNQLSSVVQVGDEQKSFIQSESDFKVPKNMQKDKQKDKLVQDKQMLDLQKKKMAKSGVIIKQPVIKQKELKESISKQSLINRIRTQSQHANKKDWK